MAPALAGAALGIDQRANIVKTICRDQPRGDQFPKRGFHFSFQSSRSAHEIGEERCTALSKIIERVPRWQAQTARDITILVGMLRNHPVGVFAHEESYGRD